MLKTKRTEQTSYKMIDVGIVFDRGKQKGRRDKASDAGAETAMDIDEQSKKQSACFWKGCIREIFEGQPNSSYFSISPLGLGGCTMFEVFLNHCSTMTMPVHSLELRDRSGARY